MIRQLDLKHDFNQAVELIYDTFTACNYADSSESLRDKMNSLFGPNMEVEYTKNIFINSSIIFVSTNQGKINGIIRGKNNRIANLFVDKNFHGKGIGRKLLKRFEEEAKSKGYTSLYLKPSKYAYDFYIRNGYKIKNDKYLEKII